MSDHTPISWHLVILGGETTAGCPRVGVIPELRLVQHDRATYLNPEDAAFIVKAVNSHDDLVEALEWCLERLASLNQHGPLRTKCEAALAKAKG